MMQLITRTRQLAKRLRKANPHYKVEVSAAGPEHSSINVMRNRHVWATCLLNPDDIKVALLSPDNAQFRFYPLLTDNSELIRTVGDHLRRYCRGAGGRVARYKAVHCGD